MEARGTPISDGLAQQLATEAEKALRDRLQNGGKKMPPFKHLRGDEVEALIGYLQKLGGVPSPKNGDLTDEPTGFGYGDSAIRLPTKHGISLTWGVLDWTYFASITP